jgi:hypothetical protein
MTKKVTKKEKGFRTKFSDGEIQWVKEQVLLHKTYLQITREFAVMFEGKTISEAGIRKYSKKYNWDTSTGSAMIVANKDIAKAGKTIKEMTEEHLQAYDDIADVGRLKVDVPVRSGLEAAQMVDMAIKGKRNIMTGMVAVQLVGDLIDILERRVTDRAVRDDIIRDLRELTVRYQNLGM